MNTIVLVHQLDRNDHAVIDGGPDRLEQLVEADPDVGTLGQRRRVDQQGFEAGGHVGVGRLLADGQRIGVAAEEGDLGSNGAHGSHLVSPVFLRVCRSWGNTRSRRRQRRVSIGEPMWHFAGMVGGWKTAFFASTR